jgi:protein kinase A
VWLARLAKPKDGDDGTVYALKVLRKVDGMSFEILAASCAYNCSVIRLKQVEHVRNERNVLSAVAGYPFITSLVASFSDHDSLYMLVCAVLDITPTSL